MLLTILTFLLFQLFPLRFICFNYLLMEPTLLSVSTNALFVSEKRINSLFSESRQNKEHTSGLVTLPLCPLQHSKVTPSQVPQPTLRSDFQVSWRIWLSHSLPFIYKYMAFNPGQLGSCITSYFVILYKTRIPRSKPLGPYQLPTPQSALARARYIFFFLKCLFKKKWCKVYDP